MFGKSKIRSELPEATYIQLVRDLFDTMLPTIIMAASFSIVGVLVVSQKPNALLVLVSVLGVIAAASVIAHPPG